MNTPNFIEKIDWSELRQQKTQLLDTINWLSNFPANNIAKDLDGIVHLIDALQDYATDELGINENHIFDFEKEERELETPQELFAREMADTIYDMVVEGESIYFDMPEGMTIEFVDETLNDQYNIDIMKGDMREAILEDVLEYPEDFEKDEEGKFCYDYTLIEKYGGTIDHFIVEQFYKDKTKDLFICQHCYSDNVELKMWVKANTNKLSTEVESGEGGLEDCWCNDCQQHGELTKEEIPYLRNVIGFQVVDKYGYEHPRLISNSHICRLSQANEMIEDRDKDGNTKWRLKTVWSGIIENPIPIFGDEDPRN